jgi:hypothetical protein
MPKFLEKKLKKQYGAKSKIPYAIMNKMGYMHGSKETAKGRAAERKHIRGLGGENPKRPATRSRKQGHSFAENLSGRKY